VIERGSNYLLSPEIPAPLAPTVSSTPRKQFLFPI
jgi:hypothetical protein